MKRSTLFGISCVILVFVIALAFYVRSKDSNKSTPPTSAASSSIPITTKSDWDAGTNVKTLTNSPAGDVKIDLAGSTGEINLKSIYDQDHSRLTTNYDTGKENIFDENTSTYWGYEPDTPDLVRLDWTLNLGNSYNLNEFQVVADVSLGGLSMQTSSNGTDFTTMATYSGWDDPPNWQTFSFVATNSRYIRLDSYVVGGPPEINEIFEFKAFAATVTATHTTAATQIDGTTNFYQWQTFTPTETIPANTNIAYKFRTSKDGTAWTGWTADQSIGTGVAKDISSLVTSRDGPADNPANRYRYLQVQATLTSTDGVSTPVISQYDIGFHTNQKPNTPSAQSVTVAP